MDWIRNAIGWMRVKFMAFIDDYKMYDPMVAFMDLSILAFSILALVYLISGDLPLSIIPYCLAALAVRIIVPYAYRFLRYCVYQLNEYFTDRSPAAVRRNAQGFSNLYKDVWCFVANDLEYADVKQLRVTCKQLYYNTLLRKLQHEKKLPYKPIWATSGAHSLIVRPDGVYGFGQNEDNELCMIHDVYKDPTRIPMFNGKVVNAVAAGDRCSLFLVKGEGLYVSGNNEHNQLGIRGKQFVIPAMLHPFFEGKVIIGIATRYRRSFVVCTDGLYAMGENNEYQLGVGHNRPVREPTLLPFFNGMDIIKVAIARTHTVVWCKRELILNRASYNIPERRGWFHRLYGFGLARGVGKTGVEPVEAEDSTAQQPKRHYRMPAQMANSIDHWTDLPDSVYRKKPFSHNKSRFFSKILDIAVGDDSTFMFLKKYSYKGADVSSIEKEFRGIGRMSEGWHQRDKTHFKRNSPDQTSPIFDGHYLNQICIGEDYKVVVYSVNGRNLSENYISSLYMQNYSLVRGQNYVSEFRQITDFNPIEVDAMITANGVILMRNKQGQYYLFSDNDEYVSHQRRTQFEVAKVEIRPKLLLKWMRDGGDRGQPFNAREEQNQDPLIPELA